MLRKPATFLGLAATAAMLTGSAPPPGASSSLPERTDVVVATLVPALVLPVPPDAPPRVARKGPTGALDEATRAFFFSSVGGGTSSASGSRVSPGDPP